MSCSTLSSLVRSGQARVCVPLIDANEAPLSAEEEERREQKAARTAAWNESCALFTSFQTPADGHDDDNGDEDERASFSFVCVKSRGGRRGGARLFLSQFKETPLLRKNMTLGRKQVDEIWILP